MKVWEYLSARIGKGCLHMTLVDPASLPVPKVVRIAVEAARLGTDAIMVGGSTGITMENLDQVVLGIKRETDLPVIHFPNSAGALSVHVDAVYFLSMLNSRDPRFITREQARGAPFLEKAGIEAIGMGYVVVEPGMTVGRVSAADLVPRTPEGAHLAAGFALAAQYFGMKLFYLEAGSGADEPVPISHVEAVKKAAKIPLMVGGGIRRPEQAAGLAEAGADILVTGTIAENGDFGTLASIIEAAKARP
ncbi:MAG: geranylgeranylglyceryl/heptaprenylglyceryl phosphate synthase [Methanobacteriota archaeon]